MVRVLKENNDESSALIKIVGRSNVIDHGENDLDNDQPRYDLFGEWPSLGYWETDIEGPGQLMLIADSEDDDEINETIQKIYDNGATSEIISKLVKKFGKITAFDGETDLTKRVIAGPSVNESRRSRNFQMRTRR